MDKTTSIFRQNIISALNSTSSDEELKKELAKAINEEVNKKDKPYLVRPIKQVNKTIH